MLSISRSRLNQEYLFRKKKRCHKQCSNLTLETGDELCLFVSPCVHCNRSYCCSRLSLSHSRHIITGSFHGNDRAVMEQTVNSTGCRLWETCGEIQGLGRRQREQCGFKVNLGKMRRPELAILLSFAIAIRF